MDLRAEVSHIICLISNSASDFLNVKFRTNVRKNSMKDSSTVACGLEVAVGGN
jgi:hypothetical protein